MTDDERKAWDELLGGIRIDLAYRHEHNIPFPAAQAVSLDEPARYAILAADAELRRLRPIEQRASNVAYLEMWFSEETSNRVSQWLLTGKTAAT